jgi:hypothetical protein
MRRWQVSGCEKEANDKWQIINKASNFFTDEILRQVRENKLPFKKARAFYDFNMVHYSYE